MSKKLDQINESIRLHLGQILARHIELPKSMLVTITNVITSPNLKTAKIFFTVIPENMRGSALRIMKSSAGIIREKLAEHLKIRNIPRLNFFIDEQEVFANEVEKILDELKKK